MDIQQIESSGRQRRTQAERRQESQQGLIEAAAAVLIEQGYQAATFERISERAGYSASLVTSRFGSKDGLFVAIIEFLRVRLEAYFIKGSAMVAAGESRIGAVVEGFLSHLEEDPFAKAYYILLAAAIANHMPEQRHFIAMHDRMKARLADIVCAEQQDGAVPPELDPAIFGQMIGFFQLGIAMQYQLDPATDIARIRKVLQQLTR